jgi:hypothetical protein
VRGADEADEEVVLPRGRRLLVPEETRHALEAGEEQDDAREDGEGEPGGALHFTSST